MRDEILYTPEEVAQKLKLSKYTIYEMIKRGEISAHRIGRSLRVTESQLQTYLMQSTQSENSFEAEIVTIDDEKFAKVIGATKDVYISVTTDIEGSAKISIKAGGYHSEPQCTHLQRQKQPGRYHHRYGGTEQQL